MTTRTTALILVALDTLASVVVFNFVSVARGLTTGSHLIVAPLIVPTAVFGVAIYLVQGYRPRTDMLSVDYASQHAIAACGGLIVTLLLTFVVFPAGYELQSSRFVVAIAFVTLIPLTLGYRRLFYSRSVERQGVQPIVFVGDRPNFDSFATECATMGVTQQLIHADPGESEAATSAFGAVLDQISSGQKQVEAIVLRESARELAPETSQQLIRLYFSGVPTYTLELFHEIYWQKIPLYRLNQTWLFQEGFQIAREPVFERAKRAADMILAICGLVIAAPIIAIMGFLVWLEDRGPVFFGQNRVGLNHEVFRLYKLRTMKVHETGDRYTQPGDARITRIGRFLRKSRIDEFPQLWNVLKGDMSLIGPRAEWDKLVAEYEAYIPCYHFRHLVRPGITGWAQVNYPYGASMADTLRKLEYDLYYIRHFSFRLDATIVMKTIHIMLFGKGR
jgi:exopolysaccharide biosynthesis polyprenyl glycosylphosphotransferase